MMSSGWVEVTTVQVSVRPRQDTALDIDHRGDGREAYRILDE